MEVKKYMHLPIYPLTHSPIYAFSDLRIHPYTHSGEEEIIKNQKDAKLLIN